MGRYGVWVTSIIRSFSIKRRRYLYFKARCSAASRLYFRHSKKCGIYRRSFRKYRRRCYSRQTAVDTQACAYRLSVRQSCFAYRRCNNRAWRAFIYRQRLIRKAEADRKIQYRVLKRIMCLLKNPINSGKAKDIMKCRKKIWSTRHLNLRYPKVPKKLRCPVAYRGNRNNYKLNVRTKKNFCVGKTYGKEYFKGWMSKVQIWPVARSGSLMKARGSSTPRIWMKGYYGFSGKQCLYRRSGARANLPLGKSPYSIEARIRPSRKSHWSGGIVGYGLYRRKNSVNAFRIAGRDGLYNYYWGNDLYASASWIKKRGCRVHDGRYHRVAATFDGWYQRIYVDFRVVRWRRTTGPVSLRYKKNFCIGKTYGREYFKGRMGDVRVYRWARAVADMRKRGC